MMDEVDLVKMPDLTMPIKQRNPVPRLAGRPIVARYGSEGALHALKQRGRSGLEPRLSEAKKPGKNHKAIIPCCRRPARSEATPQRDTKPPEEAKQSSPGA